MKPLEAARGLEKAGKVDAAVQAYRDAGAVDDAARLLGASRRQREAGQLLLDALGVQPAQVGQLEPAGKKRALMAAIFFGKAGENDLAVRLFLGLGEQRRAVELLERAGDMVAAAKIQALKPGQLQESGSLLGTPRVQATAVGGTAVSLLSAQKSEQQGKLEVALQQYLQLKRFGEAAAVAEKLGRMQDAAQLYADAGLPYPAAHAYLQLGDTGKALENLTRVPRSDERYRTAAMQAIRLATNLGSMDFKVEHFLGAFVKTGPVDADEIAAFEQLAQLYVTHDLPGNAREALDKILARVPDHPRARQALLALEDAVRPSAAVARQVLADAEPRKRKQNTTSMPDLGALPSLGGDEEPVTLLRHDPELVRRVTGEVLGEAEVIGEAVRFEDGATIAGRYRLEGKLGQGGMATVWKAWDTDLEEHVALKVFAPAQSTEVLLQRFKQELKLSRQLQHPNIIRLYDIGEHQGFRYISMELLVGQSLKENLLAGIDLREGLRLLVQACAGLAAAHAAGVVHRDVKPDNFFVTKEGLLKVMDFGIAKQHQTPGVTVAGSIAGTPLYMSPEQISNFSTVTHLTDVYALGICAYEVFTGKVPFAHEELVPLLMMQVNQIPERPRTRNPRIPEELERIILRCLQKQPAARFQSCGELGQALEAVRAGMA